MQRRLINRIPGRTGAFYLGALPFLLIVVAYVAASGIRLADNPDDKLLPSLASLGNAIVRVAVEPDKRTGEIVLWVDTIASLARLLAGLGIATLFGLFLGITIGLIPYIRATLANFIAVLSMVPALAILPVLFIVFGLGEVSKIALIVIGISPFITRDLALRVSQLPHEQIVKAQTLGASTWQIVLRIVLPQMWPRLIDAVRLSLGPSWLFLIAAEAIAATEGLGYRIFLVRRYLAMDVILPYVAWITLLAFLLDAALAATKNHGFAWYRSGKSA